VSTLTIILPRVPEENYWYKGAQVTEIKFSLPPRIYEGRRPHGYVFLSEKRLFTKNDEPLYKNI